LHEYADGDGAIKVYNLGFALEYGVTDWNSAAVQWAPGVNLRSEVDSAGDDINVNGLSDIFVGAKIQIVGEKAPVQSSAMRFAVATGAKIPLPGADMEEQFTNYIAGDATTFQQADKHVLGIGARGYFDYIINKLFYMNLYTEFTYYPIEADYAEANVLNYYAVLLGAPYEKINYGYQLVVEAEPHFDYMLDNGIRVSAGLPITYVMTPNYELDEVEQDDTGTSVLKLAPSVSAFLTKTPLPLEFKLGYSFPVMGVNVPATNALTFQAKAYFKF
ncbi:MAG: hypothetical protein RBT68_08950, partial [Spirochaetia bacterium]|nr:hypothetical protein [Spirochaetia bacterium]